MEAADQNPSAHLGTPSVELAEAHQAHCEMRFAEAEGTLVDALRDIQWAEMQSRQTLHPSMGQRRAGHQNLLEIAETEHVGLVVDLAGIAAAVVAVERQDNPFA